MKDQVVPTFFFCLIHRWVKRIRLALLWLGCLRLAQCWMAEAHQRTWVDYLPGDDPIGLEI